MTYRTHTFNGFREADILGRHHGGSFGGWGETFVMPAQATTSFSISDNDSSLSGDSRRNERSNDRSGQFAEVTDSDGNVLRHSERLYAERVIYLEGSDGKRYALVEIEIEGGYAPGAGDDYFTFYNDGVDGEGIPPAGVTLTVIGSANVRGRGLDYSKLWQNQAPEAMDDMATVMENDPRSTVFDNLLANDVDADGNSLKIVGFNNGDGVFQEWFNGSNGGEFCILDENGTVDFRQGSDFDYLKEGEVAYTSFTYTVSDGNGGTDTATVSVTIEGKNDAPEFSNIPSDNKLYIDENTTVVETIQAFDVEGENITYSLKNGIDSEFLEIDPDTGVLSFNQSPDFETPLDETPSHPNPAFDNKYGVTIVATDETGASTEQTVWVIVNDVDESQPIAPTAVNDAATTGEDVPVIIDVLANDSDLNGDTLSISSVENPDGGRARIKNGKLIYTPDPGFVGTDVFEYTVTDGNGLSSTAQVSVEVEDIANPILGDGTYVINNHPTIAIPDGDTPWGLRLDGLLTGNTNDKYTFDFEYPGAKMYMTLDGDEVRVFGKAYGGLLDGDGNYIPEESGFWEIEFNYNSVNELPGDDDLATDPNSTGSSTGTIKQLFGGGIEADLSDFAGKRGNSFYIGDDIKDNGFKNYDGVAGWGWLNHSGSEQHVYTSDFAFVIDPQPVEPPKPICAKLVGDVELDEGAQGSYKIQLDGVSDVDQYFTLTVTSGSAQEVGQWAGNQDIMWGGFYDTRRGVGGSLIKKTYGYIPQGRAGDTSDDRVAVGPSDASWDYTIYQDGQIQTNTITVKVAAGETMSDSFQVQTWLEQVTVDLDAGNTAGYFEGTETFSIQVTNADTEVCVDHLEVLIKDQTDYDFVSPIAIDLNGNGIETLSVNQGITFDLLNTGTQVNTGWLSSGDGFLAVDNNGNGKIDNRTELFGGGVGDGFAKLATFDSNQDGWVNTADAKFGDLLIWQDANSNAATDKGELVSLATAGIASLKVDHETTFSADAQGNILGERSVALTQSGNALDMVDVYFRVV